MCYGFAITIALNQISSNSVIRGGSNSIAVCPSLPLG